MLQTWGRITHKQQVKSQKQGEQKHHETMLTIQKSFLTRLTHMHDSCPACHVKAWHIIRWQKASLEAMHYMSVTNKSNFYDSDYLISHISERETTYWNPCFLEVFFAIIWSFSNRKSFKLACIFFSLQTFSPINNQGLLRSLQVIICVLWQPQAAANWQASMREMLCKFYEWQRRLVEWLCTCNFDLLGAVHAGRWKGRQERRRPWIRFCALHKKSTFEMNC